MRSTALQALCVTKFLFEVTEGDHVPITAHPYVMEAFGLDLECGAEHFWCLKKSYGRYILDASKSWEGRPASGIKKAGLSVGDTLHFKICGRKAYPRIDAVAVEVREFASCRDMLIEIGVAALLPWREDVADIDGAVQEYESFGERYRGCAYTATGSKAFNEYVFMFCFLFHPV